MINKELEAKILRYHHVEKWPVGTIAHQLGVHHNTVTRVLHQAGLPSAEKVLRPSLVDPFLPFIMQTLEKFPRLHASRLYQMVRERGYPGQPDHFRHIIARLRPRRPAEAYLRLRTLPGEQGQVDWGHFGKLTIGRAQRPLMAFVMVLSWSRKVFLRFFLDQRMSSFLQGHVEAFSAFGGCPKVLLYDNLKSAVSERKGDAIRFNPTLLDFASHYRYEPRPVAPYRGNEKARVERAIRYIRTSFFAARQFAGINDLNEQATEWCEGLSSDRRCPEDRSLTVREAFAREQSQLMALPEDPFVTADRVEVKVGKTPYVRYDLNDYSVPHDQVRRTLVVLASEKRLRIIADNKVVAEHKRRYDKGAQVEDQAHLDKLLQQKREARQHRGLDRLQHAAPNVRELMMRLAERGLNLGSATTTLLRLLDNYGAETFEAAVAEALSHHAPHTRLVGQILERMELAAKKAPALAVDLPDDPRVRNLTVKPHDLKAYDDLKQEHHHDPE